MDNPSGIPLNGTITRTVPDSWVNGSYRLSYVDIYDAAGNHSSYVRNGTIYKYPQGATGPTGHNLNFSAADFTLEGSTADSATPALVSFAVGPKTVTPGQDVSIDYAVSDDSDEITYVYFTFADAIGNTRSLGVDNPSGIPLNGTITRTVPDSWVNGSYRLSYVDIYDAAGNHSSYVRNGTIYKYPQGATGPTGHNLSFSAADFTLEGSTAGSATPALVSFAVGPKTVTPGQDVSIDYAVSDDSDEITYVYFTFADAIGNTRSLGVDNPSGIPLNGTITRTVPDSWVNGSYRLSYVDIYDAAGNHASYVRNGTIYKYPQGATGPTGHNLNFSAADFRVATAPGAPLGVTAKAAGDLAAEVRWQLSSANGSAVTGYTITSSPGGLTQTVEGSATAGTVSGLVNGTEYTFTVTATNAIGDSVASQPSNQIVAGRVPSAPTGVSAVRGDQQATVTWDAAAGNGSAVTGYTITSSPGGLTQTVEGSATAGTVSGLVNGTEYTFTVTATNAIGEGAASVPSKSVTPAGVPHAPTGVSAVRGDQQATVTWDAAAGNGSAVTGYTITSSPGGLTQTVEGSATAGTVSGLVNGTEYTFTVTATNAIGEGAASVPSKSVTPAGVPHAPTGVSAVRGDQQATVTWDAAAGNGSAVPGYTITSSPGGLTQTVEGSATAGTVSGLVNGTEYTFTVTATNAIGEGLTSASSRSVVPAAPPSRVSKPAVIVKGRSVTLRWKSPNDNGSRVVRYTIISNRGQQKTVGTAVHKVVFKRLTPGRYKFRVTATNDIGDGPTSPVVRVRIRRP